MGRTPDRVEGAAPAAELRAQYDVGVQEHYDVVVVAGGAADRARRTRRTQRVPVPA